MYRRKKPWYDYRLYCNKMLTRELPMDLWCYYFHQGFRAYVLSGKLFKGE